MINSGFKTLGVIEHASRSEQYIVVGVGRGGTSAVAASLHALGVPLGVQNVEFGGHNYENFEMAVAFRSRKWKRLKELIAQNEATYQKFAWKLPDSNKQLTRINKYFSNPYYIFVYRDILAIANRKDITLDIDLISGMKKNLADYERIVNFSKRNGLRSLHVSYEKMLLDKKGYAKELAKFCGVKASDDLLDKVAAVIEVSPAHYLQWSSNSRFKKTEYQGRILHASKSHIEGWMASEKDSVPLTVEVLINNVLFGEYSSDVYREELVTAGKSESGKAGFYIEFPKARLKDNDVVMVRPKGCKEGLSSLPL